MEVTLLLTVGLAVESWIYLRAHAHVSAYFRREQHLVLECTAPLQ